MRVPGQPIVEFDNVSITLGGRKILDRESFSVAMGELFVVIGYSGTGKSVTLQNLTGLLIPDEGSIKVAGEQIVGMNEDDLRAMRRRFGYLFQHGALIKWLTVGENVELPLKEHTSYSRRRRREIVHEKLSMVAMDQDADKYPNEISGGMQKRAALARAIALDPEIVLFDEPTSGLDPVIGHQIDSLIVRINRELGITCIVVTHDMESAYFMADRIAFFHKGRMDYIGTPEEVRNTTDQALRHFITGGREGQVSMRTKAAIIRQEPNTSDSSEGGIQYAESYDPDAPDLTSEEYLLKQLPKSYRREVSASGRRLSVPLSEAPKAQDDSFVLSDEELDALDDQLAERAWLAEERDEPAEDSESASTQASENEDAQADSEASQSAEDESPESLGSDEDSPEPDAAEQDPEAPVAASDGGKDRRAS